MVEVSPEELKEKQLKILKEYLGPFFVKPDQDKTKKEALGSFFQIELKEEERPKIYSAYSSSKENMNQIVQFFLLSYKRRLFWKAYNSYEVVQAFLNQEDFMGMTMSFPHCVIYHTGSEMANKRLPELVRQVLEVRQLKQMTTLFVSQVHTKEFGVELINPFVSIERKGSEPTFNV